MTEKDFSNEEFFTKLLEEEINSYPAAIQKELKLFLQQTVGQIALVAKLSSDKNEVKIKSILGEVLEDPYLWQFVARKLKIQASTKDAVLKTFSK